MAFLNEFFFLSMPFVFDEKSLLKHTGQTFFERGRSYRKKNRVLEVKRKGEDAIVGKVRGSDWKPYTTTFVISNRGGIKRSSCNCPLEGGCKHVAALGLSALDLFPELNRIMPLSVGVKNGMGKTKGSVKTISKTIEELMYVPEEERVGRVALRKKSQPKKPTQPEWMKTLGRILSYEENAEVSESKNGRDRPVLQGIVRFASVKIRGEAHWRLEIRPRVLYRESGKVSVSDIRWDKYGYSFGWAYEYLPREQKVWLAEMSGILDWSTGKLPWLSISEERASYVWHLLREAVSLGIKLFQGDSGKTELYFDERLLRRVIVLSDDEYGNLSVSERVFMGDDLCGDFSPTLVGTPPVFAWRILSAKELEAEGKSSEAVGDMPLSIALHPVEARSARIPGYSLVETFTVPKRDIPNFVTRFLPKLMKERDVQNESVLVTLPEAGRPALSVTVRRGRKKQSILIAVRARYGETDIAFSSAGEIIDAGMGMMILRALEEERLLKVVPEEIFRSFPPAWDITLDSVSSGSVLKDDVELVGLEAARFLRDFVPVLEGREPEVFISIADDVPVFSELTAEPEIEFAVLNQEGDNDWFNLNIVVTVGGESAPLPLLLAALADNQEFLLLENGQYFSLRHSAFQKLRTLLEEARQMGDAETKGISVSRFQADFWRELSELGIVKEQSDRWEKTMHQLLAVKEVALPEHPDLGGALLRPYQHEGFAWLSFLREHGLGGVLGDDMGLGKTIQAIALMMETFAREPEKIQGKNGTQQKQFLVVAPTSVVENWEGELDRFAPTLRKVIMRSGDRTEAFRAMRNAQVIVTSYSLLVRDFDRYAERRFDTLILDEAQFVKNYQSKSYMNIRKIKAETRLALTGTPMENNTMELWAIFSIVAPGLFGLPEHFRENFQKPIEKGNDAVLLTKLQSRIRPFFLRRKKDVVAQDLPPKTEQVLSLDMHPKHQKLYDLHLQRERQRVLGLLGEAGGMQKHRFEVFKSLMKMRRLSLHPGLIDERHQHIPSVKLDELLEQVKTLAAEGHKALIFSQFTSFLAYVRVHLDSAGFDYLYLDGATKKRGELVRRFQNDETQKIFLISLKAGGFGLNLTAADYCFILDPWWNPAVEMQAIDRTHRIGQTKNVFVYKMITKGTIEEKVLKLQQKKRALFDSVLEKGAEFHQLFTEKDVRDLFS